MTFITANKKVRFVLVVYLLRLDIVLKVVVEELSKLVTKQLQVLCFLPLSVSTNKELHLNFRI